MTDTKNHEADKIAVVPSMFDITGDAEDIGLSKVTSARELHKNLKRFAESIAADTSGDGHFDAEIYKAIEIARLNMLRWISINGAPAKPSSRDIVTQITNLDDEYQ